MTVIPIVTQDANACNEKIGPAKPIFVAKTGPPSENVNSKQ